MYTNKAFNSEHTTCLNKEVNPTIRDWEAHNYGRLLIVNMNRRASLAMDSNDRLNE